MIDIVLLASGHSKRFGSENKLLYKVNGKELFRTALENALYVKSVCFDIIDKIVVVSWYSELEKICKEYHNITYVYNDHSEQGISSSLHLGLDNTSNAVMFMVCDQPYLKGDTLVGLVNGYLQSNKSLACLCTNSGTTSNPCIFDTKWRNALYAISGDKGGKAVIKQNPTEVYLHTADNRELEDIDVKYDKLPTFPFMSEKGHIISIVGAGGKTSLMYNLADSFAGLGHKTLVSTTTHIYKPEGLAKTPTEVYNNWNKGQYAVVGDECANNKLKIPQSLLMYINMADTVLLEADGAKGLSCKVPRDKEPVIIPQSDIVIAVLGLDSIGKQVLEVCFNAEGVAELLNCDLNHILSCEDAVTILSSERGLKKGVDDREYFVILNKCDDVVRQKYADKIIGELKKIGVVGYVTQLR